MWVILLAHYDTTRQCAAGGGGQNASAEVHYLKQAEHAKCMHTLKKVWAGIIPEGTSITLIP
jgi:hypothetical protein